MRNWFLRAKKRGFILVWILMDLCVIMVVIDELIDATDLVLSI